MADALSRLPVVEDNHQICQHYEVICQLNCLRSTPINSQRILQWTCRDYFNRQHELSLQDGCILWENRVVVPSHGRKRILEELHEAHPGVTKMKSLARSYFWWPNIDAAIEELIRQCPPCHLIQKTLPKVPLLPGLMLPGKESM